MPPRGRTKSQLSVAVTGVNGSFGRIALPRLLAHESISRVLALDLYEPRLTHPKLSWASVDLTLPSGGEAMTRALGEHRVSALVHLAFFSGPVLDPAYAHELEAFGTTQALASAAASGVRTMVMSSTTLIYGASPRNPNYLVEDRALPPHGGSRFVTDKVAAERQVQEFSRRHASVRSTVLRFAPIVGPRSDNPFTRYLRGRLVPMVMGYDPLVQCVHEDDAAEAVVLALLAGKSGPFNVVGRGVLALSQAIRCAGGLPLPTPMPVSRLALGAFNALGLSNVAPTLLDYLRYVWVADGSRAERELLFRPRHTTREALLSIRRAPHAAAGPPGPAAGPDL